MPLEGTDGRRSVSLSADTRVTSQSNCNWVRDTITKEETLHFDKNNKEGTYQAYHHRATDIRYVRGTQDLRRCPYQYTREDRPPTKEDVLTIRERRLVLTAGRISRHIRQRYLTAVRCHRSIGIGWTFSICILRARGRFIPNSMSQSWDWIAKTVLEEEQDT